MNELTPRRRRRQTNSTDISPEPSTETPAAAENVEPLADDVPPKPFLALPTAIDEIRSELLDDNYHNQLAESEYWNEAHSWSKNLPGSDDYWHFLGV